MLYKRSPGTQSDHKEDVNVPRNSVGISSMPLPVESSRATAIGDGSTWSAAVLVQLLAGSWQGAVPSGF